MTKRSVRLLTAFAAAAAASAVVASAAPASAVAVGPHQYFEGFVNTSLAKATIGVACAGPSALGHPLPDQTVAVELVVPPVAPNEGYTGLEANSIVAWLNWPVPTAVTPPVKVATFTSYGTAAIPTNLLVPCSGSGVMTFVPTPDLGGISATVDVTFLSTGA